MTGFVVQGHISLNALKCTLKFDIWGVKEQICISNCVLTSGLGALIAR